MHQPSITLYLLMFIAGCAVPTMASINATLGSRLGNPMAAVLVLCVIASAGAAALLAISSRGIEFPVWQVGPLWQYLGGLLFLVYIASATYAVPYIGLGNAIFLVLLGQLCTAAVIDHFGLLGAPIAPITGRRFAGLLLMVVGVLLARRDVLPDS